MLKKSVFITRPILDDGLQLLRSKGYDVSCSQLDRPMTRDELMAQARNANAMITMLTDNIDKIFLEHNSHLKVISNYAVGFNNIDLSTASKLSIPIGNTPDVLTEATAEIALGLMIAASREFHSASESVRLGNWSDWNPCGHLGHGLKGKTLGIVGMGRIGERLAQMCFHAFDMKIKYTANSEKSTKFKAQKLSLEELLTQSDFISVHLPLIEKTKNLIGKNQFQLMKKNAVLINTARGEIINQDDLIEALKNKTIFAAGLDVTTPEPLPLNNELLSLKNVFILPHIGSATYEARRAMSILAAENIIAGFEGRLDWSWVNKKDLLP